MKHLILLFAMVGPMAVPINAQELEVEGGVKIGDVAEEPPPGTIRWTGIDFAGWNGLDWVSLTNLPYEISFISDNDDNEYRTVVIGDQEWMAENLRTAWYNDNVFIPRKISATD